MVHKFCICSPFISTLLDYPVNSNPVVLSPSKVSNKIFATDLSNPCTLNDESSLESFASQNIDLGMTMSLMINKLSRAKETTEAILKEEDLPCTASRFPADKKIPLAQNYANNFTEEVIHLFYTSFLNNTADVFYLSEQIEKEWTDICQLDIVFNGVTNLTSQMKAAMCSFRQLAITLTGSDNDSMKDAHKQIFNKELVDLSQCSKFVFITCSTLQSVLKFLIELKSYLNTLGPLQ